MSGAGASYAHDTLGRRTYTETLMPGPSKPRLNFHWQGLRLTSVDGSLGLPSTYSAQASDGATWSVENVTDESGRPFAGVYAAGSDTVALQRTRVQSRYTSLQFT